MWDKRYIGDWEPVLLVKEGELPSWKSETYCPKEVLEDTIITAFGDAKMYLATQDDARKGIWEHIDPTDENPVPFHSDLAEEIIKVFLGKNIIKELLIPNGYFLQFSTLKVKDSFSSSRPAVVWGNMSFRRDEERGRWEIFGKPVDNTLET